MKRLIQFVSLILILAMFLGIPATAVEEISPYASNYFLAFRAYIYKASSTEYQVWFEVTGKRTMDELGVNYIEVEYSSDNVNWSSLRTYEKDDYSQMIDYDTGDYTNYVSFTPVSGYYYRAHVRFYAKDSTGTGTYNYYYAT